jgi:RNA polymerase sigma-70 factor (ECF subfamily)
MESLSLTLAGLPLRRATDEVVATRATEGDPAAFGELYRRYRPRVVALCVSRLGDSHGAEDAAQEAFSRVLRAAPQAIENAQAWLFTIAGNVCRDTQRKASNGELPSDAPDLGADLPTPDSATEVMRRETARVVFLALRRLPARSRTALMLREFHGMSSAEIAESMGISKGAVDPLVSRARDAFGTAYAEVGHFPARCRENVERIYRELGTGLESAEASELRAHIETCARCRAEHQRAHSPRYQRALIPFLVPGVAKLGILGRALHTAASSPGVMRGVPLAPVATAAVLGVALIAPLAVNQGLTHRVDVPAPSLRRLEAVAPRAFAPAARTAALGSAASASRRGDAAAEGSRHHAASSDLCQPDYRAHATDHAGAQHAGSHDAGTHDATTGDAPAAGTAPETHTGGTGTQGGGTHDAGTHDAGLSTADPAHTE